MSFPSQQLDQLTEKDNPLLIPLQNRFFYTLVIRSKAILILRLIFVFCIIYLFIYGFDANKHPDPSKFATGDRFSGRKYLRLEQERFKLLHIIDLIRCTGV